MTALGHRKLQRVLQTHRRTKTPRFPKHLRHYPHAGAESESLTLMKKVFFVTYGGGHATMQKRIDELFPVKERAAPLIATRIKEIVG